MASELHGLLCHTCVMMDCSYPLASCLVLSVVFCFNPLGNDRRSEREYLQGAKRNRGIEVRDVSDSHGS